MEEQDKNLAEGEPFEIEEIDDQDLEDVSGGGPFQEFQDNNASGCNSGCNTGC